MDKDQVEVRGIAKFDTAQLAVANDGEIGVTGRTILAPGVTMATDQIRERHVDYMVQHHFGNPRQVVTDLH